MLHIGMLTNNQVVMCQYGFRAVTGTDGWQQVLVDDWFTTVLPSFRTLLSSATSVEDLTVHDVLPGTAAPASHFLASGLAGFGASPALPPQVALIIQHRSGLAGRANRGRVYLPGCPLVAKTSSGINVTGTFRAAQGAYAAVAMARYGPSGSSPIAKLVTISRQLDGAPRDPIVGVPITSMVAGFTIATQRRRNNRF